MIALSDIIVRRFPSAKPLRDFVIRDDGKGQYVDKWDEGKLGPQPSPEQLTDWLANPPPPSNEELAKLAVETQTEDDRLAADQLKKFIAAFEDKSASPELQAEAIRLLLRDYLRRIQPLP